ncbi:uncharacterized protein BDV14DRAFT_180155 [Aspergillus stella-maris]|uniref:uncharacterized protein n=1 Tax=Aspergillus stella-maris TaxID=1810926 RepID=UPI003CCD4395
MGKLEELEARLERQETQILDLQREMQDIKDRLPFNMPVPKKSCFPDTEPFQHHFLSTYKRDKLGAADEKDEAWIQAGKRYIREHDSPCGMSCLKFVRCRWGVDCKVFDFCSDDAELYQFGKRTDHWVFKVLYGVHPITARGISERRSIL